MKASAAIAWISFLASIWVQALCDVPKNFFNVAAISLLVALCLTMFTISLEIQDSKDD